MKKKTLLIVIIILVILLIAAGIFAYVYLGTDLLRSEKELFAKYTTQVVSEDEFFPTVLKDYETKKTMVPYESNGTISVDTEIIGDTTSTSMQEIQSALGYANNTSITFQGKVDNANNKFEENFQVNYTDSVNLPFSIKRDGDRYGILVQEISQTNYVAIDNNNIPGLLQSLGATDVTNVPNKIEIPEIESLNLTDEEKAHIKDTYITPMYEGISEDKFTKIKNEDGTVSYELNLTPEEVKQMVSQMLQTLSTDTMMIDKLNSIYSEIETDFNLEDDSSSSYYSSYYSATTTQTNTDPVTAEGILELKNEIDSETIEGGNIKITVTESNRSTSKLAIELTAGAENTSTTDTVISMQNDTLTNSTYSNPSDMFNSGTVSTQNSTDMTEETDEPDVILFEISKVQNDAANITYTANVSYNNEVAYTMNLGYTGLNTNTPTEMINMVMGDPESVLSTYSIQKNITFGNEVTIDGFDENTTVVLNNYSSEQLLPFLMQYVTRLGEINTNQMTQIGYPTDAVNPLMLWAGGVGLVTYIQASDTITNMPTMSEEEADAFNATFESYGGIEIRGSRVKTLVDTVRQNNLTAIDASEKVQVLTTAGESTVNASAVNQSYTETTYLQALNNTIQSGSTYTVSFGYDGTTGKITTIYILEANGATPGTTTETDTNTIGGTTTNTNTTGTVPPQINY